MLEAEAGRSGVWDTGAGAGTPAPGRRNADADGASLIGVPTVGGDGSPPRGVPKRGTSSSTIMWDVKPFDVGDVFIASGLAAKNSGD